MQISQRPRGKYFHDGVIIHTTERMNVNAERMNVDSRHSSQTVPVLRKVLPYVRNVS